MRLHNKSELEYLLKLSVNGKKFPASQIVLMPKQELVVSGGFDTIEINLNTPIILHKIQ